VLHGHRQQFDWNFEAAERLPMPDPRTARFPAIVIATRKGDGQFGVSKFGQFAVIRLIGDQGLMLCLPIFSGDESVSHFVAEFTLDHCYPLAVEREALLRILDIVQVEHPELSAVILDPDGPAGAIGLTEFRAFLQGSATL
jgi:hypothetical protein